MVRLGSFLVLAACSHAARPPLTPAPVAAVCTEAPRHVGTKRPITGPVERVTITGAGSQLPEVVKAVHTEAGNLFDPAILHEDVRRLWELGIVSQVDVRVTDAGDGPEVALALVAPPRIARVVGGERYAEVAMLRALEGALYDEPRVARIATLVEKTLVANGYAHAHLRTSVAVACEQATLRVDVDAGPRFRIAELVIAGSALPITRSAFSRNFGQTNAVGGVFDAAGFDTDLATWLERHRAYGWIEAKASPPAVDYDPTHARVSVRTTITPGPRYVFGKLALDGGDARARGLFERVVGPLRGRTYDAAQYLAALGRLKDELFDAGYSVNTTGGEDATKHAVEIMFVLTAVKG